MVTIESELRDQRVGQRELGNGKARNCELAEAEQSNPKLRNGHNPKGKLPYGNNALGRTGRGRAFGRERLGRYLNDMCSIGKPNRAASDLYSNPRPSDSLFVGCSTPQFGQETVSSVTNCPHRLHFMPHLHAYSLLPRARSSFARLSACCAAVSFPSAL